MFKYILNINRNFKHLNIINFNRKLFSVIGLDMGATNTCIAVMEPSGPRVIENAEGNKINLNIFRIKNNSFLYKCK
jgi:molecular chaperone DnaK (HSP70)